nr:carboxylesterase family protein [Candidatus Sigynarchaeota archaeon]
MPNMDAVATTPLGKLRGIQREHHVEFLGIRYAEAPVGKLRYAEPRIVKAWEGIYDAIQYGPMAPQALKDNPSIELEESEDCLLLNVYTPVLDDKKRPVMFFIHGGAFALGSGSRPRDRGVALVERENVVLVCIQYRLGPLGFLAMAGVPPNLGLKDMICALRWVRDNIAAFGGDPENVTIFGQSAGGISVSYLLVMPAARGLFHKAIMHSGTFPLEPVTPEKASRITKLLLSKLHVADGDVTALRKLPWQKIMKAQAKIARNMLSGNHHVPVVDGTTIPKDCISAIRSGFSASIPLVIGHTSSELPIFEGFFNKKNALVRNVVKSIISNRMKTMGLKKENIKKVLADYKNLLYASRIRDLEYDQILMDLGFRIPAIIVADAHCTGNAPTYFYEFAYKAPKLGAAVHVLDMYFIFGTLDTSDGVDVMKPSGTKEEKQLSERMMDAWANFARKGDPSTPNLPRWNPYDRMTKRTMVIDIGSKLVENHLEPRIKIWKSFSLY